MRILGYLAVCCLAVVALAMPAHAIERAASLPYVYEVTKAFPKCGWNTGDTTGQVLTTDASGVMKCVTVSNSNTAIDIPSCALTEYLGVDSAGKLACKKMSAVCAANEVLNRIDNDTYGCTALSAAAVTTAPQCGAEKVLQGDGKKTFSCVNIGDLALPKCDSGEVLTNLGGAVQCVDTTKSHFPADCGAGQALTVENGKFICTTFTTGTACTAGTMALLNKGITYCVATSCAENERLTFSAGKPICKDLPIATTPAPTCSGASLSGYSTVFAHPQIPFPQYAYNLTSDDVARLRAFTFPIGSLAFIPNANGTVKVHTFSLDTRQGAHLEYPTPLVLTNGAGSSQGAFSSTTCSSKIQCTGTTGWQLFNTSCITTTYPDNTGTPGT